MSDQWEDIAYGPPATAEDQWEDVAVGPQAQPSVLQRFGKYAQGLALQGAQGATLGLGDEAAAGIVSLLPGRGSYDQELSRIRGMTNEFSQQHPYISAATDIAGSIPAIVATGGAAAPETALGRVAFNAGSGGLVGALTGFNKGEGGAEQRSQDALQGAKWGTLLGGGLSALGEGASKLLGGSSKIASDMQKGYQEDLLGAGQAERKAGAMKGLTRRDAAGNPVPKASQAVTSTTHLEDEMRVLADDGFFSTVKDNPRVAENQAAQRVEQLSAEAAPLVQTADQVVAQSGRNVRFTPNWKPAVDYITELEKTSPKTAQSVANELKDKIAAWNQSGRTLQDMMEYRRSYGKLPQTFNELKPDVENHIAELNRRIYLGFKDSLEQNVDAILGKVDPSLVGKFNELNSKIHAYLSFSDTMAKRIGGNGPRATLNAAVDLRDRLMMLGGAGIGYSVNPALGFALAGSSVPGIAGKIFPATAARGYGQMARLLSAGAQAGKSTNIGPMAGALAVR